MLSRLLSARHEGVWGVVVRVVEEEEIHAVALIRQVLIQLGVDNGGKRSSAWCWWDYVADNIRLGKEEEEPRHRKCDNDDNDNDDDGYRGGGRGGGFV
jgi:hypothetical protein